MTRPDRVVTAFSFSLLGVGFFTGFALTSGFCVGITLTSGFSANVTFFFTPSSLKRRRGSSSILGAFGVGGVGVGGCFTVGAAALGSSDADLRCTRFLLNTRLLLRTLYVRGVLPGPITVPGNHRWFLFDKMRTNCPGISGGSCLFSPFSRSSRSIFSLRSCRASRSNSRPTL